MDIPKQTPHAGAGGLSLDAWNPVGSAAAILSSPIGAGYHDVSEATAREVAARGRCETAL